MIYTLTLNADELNLIAAGLAKLPFEVSAPMIAGLKQLAKDQEAAAAEAAKAAKAPAKSASYDEGAHADEVTEETETETQKEMDEFNTRQALEFPERMPRRRGKAA